MLDIIGKLIFRLIANVALALLEKLPDWFADKVYEVFGKKRPPKNKKTPEVHLFEPNCGEKPLELAQQRLMVSSAFGTYFTGLLEREHGYIPLEGQIEIPVAETQVGLPPLQSIYWTLNNPKGNQIIIIAADGGMGKSTLAAQITRCLFEKEVIDILLGDSAKNQQVDPVTGEVRALEVGYDSAEAFLQRVCEQLGIPFQIGEGEKDNLVNLIHDRLMGRRAILIADNLETVKDGSNLLKLLRKLASKDVRIIATTRQIDNLAETNIGYFLIRLRPLKEFNVAKDFLSWHVEQHLPYHPDLKNVVADLENKKRLGKLIERTGGSPLLMQLILSDVARLSWDYIEKIPGVFGKELLDFLYRARWQELGQLGKDGTAARHLLRFITTEQYKGRKITFEKISKWLEENNWDLVPSRPLNLLTERFLLVNNDYHKGNYAVFPSLIEFLKDQPFV